MVVIIDESSSANASMISKMAHGVVRIDFLSSTAIARALPITPVTLIANIMYLIKYLNAVHSH